MGSVYDETGLNYTEGHGDGPRYYWFNQKAMAYAFEKMGIEVGPNETVSVDACEWWGHMRDWLKDHRDGG